MSPSHHLNPRKSNFSQRSMVAVARLGNFSDGLHGLAGGFLLLQSFCVAISVSPHVCFVLVLILISMFLR